MIPAISPLLRGRIRGGKTADIIQKLNGGKSLWLLKT